MKCSLQPAYTQEGNVILIIYTFLAIETGSLNFFYRRNKLYLVDIIHLLESQDAYHMDK